MAAASRFLLLHRVGRTKTRVVPVESHDSTYFRWREAKERALAERATSPDIKEIYLNLADWYRCLAENAEVLEGRHAPCTNIHRERTPWD